MRRVCCKFYTRLLQFVNRTPGAKNLYSQGSTGEKVLNCFLLLRLQSKEKCPFLNSSTFSCHVTRECVRARCRSSRCLTLCDPMDCSPPGSPVHGSFPGKNTGTGCHALLQGIFPMQGSPTAPAPQADSLLLSQQGNPSYHTHARKKLCPPTVHFLQDHMAQFHVWLTHLSSLFCSAFG